MINHRPARVFTLVRRELQEYRTSLLWTPLLIAAALMFVMLLSVLLANRISAMGESLEQLVLQSESSSVSVRIEDGGGAAPTIEYRVEQRQGLPELGGGKTGGQASSPAVTTTGPVDDGSARTASLNPLLNGVHSLFLFILILVCANYLLATLFTDRRDGSILFWKSMPVSEWEKVLTSFGVALVVVPGLYIAASLLAQAACLLLGMLLVWRMEMDPYQLILGNIDFAALLRGQVGGWLLLTLWIAPTYAWLLLASAAARRSPFMTAVAPLIGLYFAEKILLGTGWPAAVITRHIPHYGGGSSAGFAWHGLQDIPGMALGLLFAVAALWAAVNLRRYRFEV